MAKQIQQTIGVRLPPLIIERIKHDVEIGEYYSYSDWVRQACREFYLKRSEQNKIKQPK